MNLLTFLFLLFIWTGLSFLFAFIPALMDRDDYADTKTGLIWVSKNRNISWFVTLFLPYCAIPYEILCEKLNGEGLAKIMVLIFILTLPLSVICTIIGGIVLIIKLLWHNFTIKYAREEEQC